MLVVCCGVAVDFVWGLVGLFSCFVVWLTCICCVYFGLVGCRYDCVWCGLDLIGVVYSMLVFDDLVCVWLLLMVWLYVIAFDV